MIFPQACPKVGKRSKCGFFKGFLNINSWSLKIKTTQPSSHQSSERLCLQNCKLQNLKSHSTQNESGECILLLNVDCIKMVEVKDLCAIRNIYLKLTAIVFQFLGKHFFLPRSKQ